MNGPGKVPMGDRCVTIPVVGLQLWSNRAGGSMNDAGWASEERRSAIEVVVLGAVQATVLEKRRIM